MTRKKRRVFQHDMEERSRALVRRVLPREWVVRDYMPDYGIDIAVEIFEPVGVRKGRWLAKAVGESFFAQIKSVSSEIVRRLRVCPKGNVGETEIDVIPYRIDVELLLMVQSLGAGVPVLLFLVTLDTERLYFICINDVIDKCIIPDDEMFAQKRTKTVYIPIQNFVSDSESSVVPLRFLAKRAKMYSAFNTFAYQENQVRHLIEPLYLSAECGLDLPSIDTLSNLVSAIKRYDFWKTTNMWKPIADVYKEVLKLEQLLTQFSLGRRASVVDSVAESRDRALLSEVVDSEEALSVTTAEVLGDRVGRTWALLKNLGNMYEELCREWFLPTCLGVLARSSLGNETLAERVLRQARSGRLDEERLLPTRKRREEDLKHEMEKLAAREGWYEVVAGRAQEMARGEVSARRRAEVVAVREIRGWRREVERLAPHRLEEFDAGIRHALGRQER